MDASCDRQGKAVKNGSRNGTPYCTTPNINRFGGDEKMAGNLTHDLSLPIVRAKPTIHRLQCGRMLRLAARLLGLCLRFGKSDDSAFVLLYALKLNFNLFHSYILE